MNEGKETNYNSPPCLFFNTKIPSIFKFFQIDTEIQVERDHVCLTNMLEAEVIV